MFNHLYFRIGIIRIKFGYKKEERAPENSGFMAEIKQQLICSLVKEAQ